MVLITLDPKVQGSSRKASIRLLTNAYDKDESVPPFAQWLAAGKGRYIKKRVPSCFEAGRAPIARYGVPKQARNTSDINRKEFGWLHAATRPKSRPRHSVQPELSIAK